MVAEALSTLHHHCQPRLRLGGSSVLRQGADRRMCWKDDHPTSEGLPAAPVLTGNNRGAVQRVVFKSRLHGDLHRDRQLVIQVTPLSKPQGAASLSARCTSDSNCKQPAVLPLHSSFDHTLQKFREDPRNQRQSAAAHISS